MGLHGGLGLHGCMHGSMWESGDMLGACECTDREWEAGMGLDPNSFPRLLGSVLSKSVGQIQVDPLGLLLHKGYGIRVTQGKGKVFPWPMGCAAAAAPNLRWMQHRHPALPVLAPVRIVL